MQLDCFLASKRERSTRRRPVYQFRSINSGGLPFKIPEARNKNITWNSDVLSLHIARVSPGFDIFFSFSLSLSSSFLDFFFFSGFPPLVDSFRAAWHPRHRLHSYNIGDNLLYHLVAPEARVSFRFAGFEPYGRLTFLASTHSRRSVSSTSTPMPCVAGSSVLLQFSIYLPSTATEISQECARRRAFENRKASTTSSRFY